MSPLHLRSLSQALRMLAAAAAHVGMTALHSSRKVSS